jgi:hypothetical protein
MNPVLAYYCIPIGYAMDRIPVSQQSNFGLAVELLTFYEKIVEKLLL